MICFELEVGTVRRSCEREFNFAAFLRGAEAGEEFFDTGEGFGGGEVLSLKSGVFRLVLFGRAGELGPFVEDGRGRGAGAALQLGFDGPGKGGSVVFGEKDVCAEGVEVFGVEE